MDFTKFNDLAKCLTSCIYMNVFRKKSLFHFLVLSFITDYNRIRLK